MIRTAAILAFVLAAASVSFTPASAQDANTEKFDLEAMSCWDVVSLPDEHAAYVMLLMQGYISGQKNNPVMSGAMIETDVAAVVRACADKPDDKAMEVFRGLHG